MLALALFHLFSYVIESGSSDHQDDDDLWELQEEADAQGPRSAEAIG